MERRRFQLHKKVRQVFSFNFLPSYYLLLKSCSHVKFRRDKIHKLSNEIEDMWIKNIHP